MKFLVKVYFETFDQRDVKEVAELDETENDNF